MALTTSAIHTAFRTVFARDANENEIQNASGFESTSSLIAALYLEPEYALNSLPVARLFTALLARDPEPAAMNFYVNAVRDGSMSMHAMANAVLNSAEASAAFNYSGLDDRAFVRQIYRTALNREGEDQGVDYWVARLESGAMDRAGLALNFAYSPEFMLKMGVREFPAVDGGDNALIIGVENMQTIHAFASGLNTVNLDLEGTMENYVEFTDASVSDVQAAVDAAEVQFNADVRFAFVVGAENGYLIGDVDGDLEADTAVTLTGLSSLDQFAHSDIV